MIPKFQNAQHRGDLVRVANQLGLTGNAAEVGVFRGHFARHNLESWHGKRYFLVDAWSYRLNDTLNGRVSADKNSPVQAHNDHNLKTAKFRVQPWLKSGKATIVRRFSEAAVQMFPDEFFDWIFIDAGHELHNVARDLRLWWPKLRPGGMFSGDDFADEGGTLYAIRPGRSWGVKTAVTRFAATVERPFFLTFSDRSHFERPGLFSDSLEFETSNHTPRAAAFFSAWYMFKRQTVDHA